MTFSPQKLFDEIYRVRPLDVSTLIDLQTKIIQLLDAGADINMIRNQTTLLHHVAEFGSVKTVQTLIERGADVNFECSGKDKRITPLHRAANCGRLEVVKLLLENDADYDIRNGANHTALDQAIQKGHLEVVKFLVDKGSSCNGPFNKRRKDPLEEAESKGYHEVVQFVKDERLGGPLAVAIRQNDLERIKALIAEGVAVNKPEDNLPLHLAIFNQNLAIIEQLIDVGADINQKNSAQETLLMQAVLTKNQAVLKLLLEKGADPNIQSSPTVDFRGSKPSAPQKTPLHVAASFGSVEMMELLLKKGAHVNPHSGGGWGDTPLNEAIVKDHTTAVQWLLDNGANPDHSNGSYASSLCVAIKNDKTDIANLLIDKGADVNIDFMESTFKDKPLYYAIEIQSIPLVNRLLEQGAQVNAPGEVCWEETPLCHAIKKGSVDIVDLILKAGANVNTPSQDFLNRKKMPLYLAVEKGNIRLITQLLARGASVNVEANTFLMDETSLHYAANMGNVEIVKLLLASNNTDVNIKTKQSPSPLHGAAAHGRVDVVTLLIQSGADVNMQDALGETALDKAIDKNYQEVIQLLINANNINMDISIISKDKVTLLHRAARTSNSFLITKLLEKGAAVDINALDASRKTPLYISASLGDVDIVKLLLKAGARVNPGPDDVWEDTPLHQAAYARRSIWDDKWDQGNYLEITQLLLAAGANVNAQSNNDLKDTPLHRAVGSRERKIIGLLLEGGAIGRSAVDINALDASGDTPLHIASFSGDVDVVKLLLEAGAQVNPGPDDVWEDTPLHQAASEVQFADQDHFGITQLLLAAGANVNAQSNDDWKDTPLYRAIKNYQDEIADLLLDHGAKVDVFDSEGYMPLHHAAAQKEGDRELIDRLIMPGIDIGAIKLQDSLVDLCLRENDLSLWTQMMLMGLHTQDNTGEEQVDHLLKITDPNLSQEVIETRNIIQNALQKTVFKNYSSPNVLRMLFDCFSRIKRFQTIYEDEKILNLRAIYEDKKVLKLHDEIFKYLQKNCTKLPPEAWSIIQGWFMKGSLIDFLDQKLMNILGIEMVNISIFNEADQLYRSNAEIFQLYLECFELYPNPSEASELLHTLTPTPGRM